MDSYTKDRATRLEEINRELTSRKLKPLSKLGKTEEGEIEVLNIVEFFEHSKRFFTDVKFWVEFPGGKHGEFTVRFNAAGVVSDGAVIVVTINGKFAIIKQWRLPLGQWTYEVPRGFGEKLDDAKAKGTLGSLKVADLPLATLVRELGENVMADAQIQSVTHLGNIAENSGTNNVTPGYYLVQITIEDDALITHAASSEGLKVYLWDSKRVKSEFGGRIADNHSITALALAQRHVESLPRL